MIDFDAHAERIARDGYTIVEDAIEPELVDALRARPRSASSASSTIEPAKQRLRGRAHRRASTTCSCTATLYERIPVHANVLPVVEGVLDRRLPRLVAVVDRHRPGRDARSRSTPTTS